MDTIFALATAWGKAGIAVVRVSGPGAHDAARTLVGGSLPPPRSSALRALRDAKGDILDHALVLRFDAPASFTGEDVVEFQVHGSTAIVSALQAALGGMPGLRPAEPGEFTRRALENNRLDLAQVEGLADLIDAETEAQRKQAQAIFGGALGALAERWRKDLIRAASLIEATIDFADEDVPIDVTPEVNALLGDVSEDLEKQIEGVRISERIRSGFEIAIVGPPNVGKSTLLNALAGREAAITSEHAGTTRDVIEVRMDLGGLAVTMLDTAGLRETEDEVESIGIARAKARAAAADLRVFLLDDGAVPGMTPIEGDIVLQAKADLIETKKNSISGKTGEGIEALLKRIGHELSRRTASAGIATRDRHRSAMQHAQQSLEKAQEMLANGPDHYDIVAEELRSAIRGLESLVGRIDVENLLDEIFASFCLGK
jgi:tRNA modification GTPase